MLKSKNLLGFAALALIIIGLGWLANNYTPNASAQATVPETAVLTGYAWSSNIGWIKFGDGTGEGGNVILENGSLSGYAWSPHVGWLKFGNIGAGPDGVSGASFSGSNLIGWARFCSVFASGCSGALRDNAYRGNWDGWLKLGGGTFPGGGVSLIGNQLTGFAWGGENIGWVKFDELYSNDPNCTGVCLGGGFLANCSADPAIVAPGDDVTWLVSVAGGSGNYTYAWDISGPGGYSASADGSEVVASYDDLGDYLGSVVVTDEDSGQTTNCEANLKVTNQNVLTVNIVGTGRVQSDDGGINCTGGDIGCVEIYEDGDVVILTPITDGVSFQGWEGCDSEPEEDGVVRCEVEMNESREVTATFEEAQKFDISIGYSPGSSSMRVNYQTQNLDLAHNSTSATIRVTDSDPEDSFDENVTLSLSVQPLINKAPSAPVPVATFGSTSVGIGGETTIYISFPTDAQPLPNVASPYAGNYQLTLTATAHGSKTVTKKINFAYIDAREVEQ